MTIQKFYQILAFFSDTTNIKMCLRQSCKKQNKAIFFTVWSHSCKLINLWTIWKDFIINSELLLVPGGWARLLGFLLLSLVLFCQYITFSSWKFFRFWYYWSSQVKNELFFFTFQSLHSYRLPFIFFFNISYSETIKRHFISPYAQVKIAQTDMTVDVENTL